MKLSRWRHGAPVLLLTLLLALLAACGGGRRESSLDESLRAYGAFIRWNQFEDALTLVDPRTLEARPLSALDLARYEQIRIVGYREGGRSELPDGTVAQAVEIEFSNIHTQATQTLIDRQVWRYDDEGKRWVLVTGLPDLTSARR